MINSKIIKTKLGFYKLEYENDIVLGLKRLHDENIACEFNESTDFSNNVEQQLKQYFDGQRKSFDLKIKHSGTAFQQKVYKALCEIKYGETKSYKQIAEKIGNEKASRAVGNANNKNKIEIIVPCHRVIGASGKLVGYAGGLDVKQKLLKLESENV